MKPAHYDDWDHGNLYDDDPTIYYFDRPDDAAEDFKSE